MLARVRPHLPALVGALAGVALLAWLGLIDFAWTDYDVEASPAFKALAEGHVVQFLALSPVYGGSLVLRAPFAALPALWGGGELAVFRAGSLACMFVVAGFGVWLVARMRALGRPLLSRATVLGLVAAGPIAELALEYGHPEEILGAVLCVAAVLAAGGRRVTWAGVLLGLAIATKAWAVLAVGPVLLALGFRPLRTLAIAALVTAALTSPLALAHPSSFATKVDGMAHTGAIFHPQQVWWFTGEEKMVRGHQTRVAPAWIEQLTHPLIVGVGLALSGLLWFSRRRRGVSRDDALLLLALLLLARCALDTWNEVYYATPFLLALVTWEGLARRRPPVLSLLATMAIWVAFQELPLHHVGGDGQGVAYLLFALPAIAGLAFRLFGRPRTSVHAGARELRALPRLADQAAV